MSKFRVHTVRFYEVEPCAIHHIAYQQKSNRFAVSREDTSIEIWDFSFYPYQEKVIPGCRGRSIEALAWYERRLFSTGLNGDVVEYDLVNLKPKCAVPSSFGVCWCMSISEKSKCLAVGTEEGYICLFEIFDGGIQYEKILDKQEGRIMCLAFHPTGDFITTGSTDTIRVWDVKSGHVLQRITVGRNARNTETIVWCIAITSDFTIVAGDSRGVVSFCDGKMGVITQSFESHRADVVCLVSHENENDIFVSGLDPTIGHFHRTSGSNPRGKQSNTWVKSAPKFCHTHDVRALAVISDFLISGGVDCTIVITNLTTKSTVKLPPIYQNQPVKLARNANAVLFRYQSSLALWRLGTTSVQYEKDNTTLPLDSNPMKLVQLKTKDEEFIMSCAVSCNGLWLAYSTVNCLRLFQINMGDDRQDFPNISLIKVKLIPPELLVPRCLEFVEDGTRLISLTGNFTLQVLQTDTIQPVLLHTADLRDGGIDEYEGSHLLAVSKNAMFAAIGTHGGRVIIYNIKDYKYHCRLPSYSNQPTVITFSPSSQSIFVAYTDHMVVEFDLDAKGYTEWVRQLNPERPFNWTNKPLVPLGITFDMKNRDMVLVHNHSLVCTINIGAILEGKDPARADTCKFHHKYKYLVFMGNMSDDFLVAVEVQPLSIIQKLPSTMKMKKFGT